MPPCGRERSRPRVMLEAMGMGAAVISANCPAGPADVVEGNAGVAHARSTLWNGF